MNEKTADSVDEAIGQVADQIGVLRATLAAAEKSPMAAAAQAPAALRQLLGIIENINLRLADLEAEARASSEPAAP